MPPAAPDTHLLRQLNLPARYEALVRRVGEEVAQLLVGPGAGTQTVLTQASVAARTRGEGLLLPLVAESGTGKTTLANNLVTFLPQDYTTTLVHTGDVTHDALVAAARRTLPTPDDPRIVPINIDHREARPPTDAELAEIKRFLREATVGSRCIVLWPQTSEGQAQAMAEAYREITGAPPIPLPVRVEGPARETWQAVAVSTLRLSNQMIESLELVGVDPRTYNPDSFRTIGEFFAQIASDFSENLTRMLGEVRAPVRLIVLFASESPNAGVLTQLTSSGRHGLLDANALVDATPQSGSGRYWAPRRGALIQAIVRLDARALCLPPSASIPALRRYGSAEIKAALDDLGVRDRGAASVNDSLRRSDLGKALTRTDRATYEARGAPPTMAEPAFQVLAEQGFNLGRDKAYNRVMAEALTAFLSDEGLDTEAVVPEEGLSESRLIPDNAIPFADVTVCLEYTWRRGDFLSTGKRSEVAQYVLDKLKAYATDLGWLQP